MLDNTLWFWIIFNAFIVGLILVDLLFFHSKEHEVSIKEALIGAGVWISIALLFNVAIYYFRGSEDALKFLTGYLVEYSLSVDNLFVFLLIFSYFHVPPALIHKALFWGIIGAIVMRAIFIVFGIVLIQNFSWMFYVFGAFLVFTGIKLGLSKSEQTAPENNPVLRLFKRFCPVTENYVGNRFFVWQKGVLMATPLFIVLLAVETTDVIFALDSIPAILGITTDIVLVYTSNIFAVLGLRSLYFALAGTMKFFHYLHYGLALILTFIGLKMLFGGFIHVPIFVTLSVIFLILSGSIIFSILYPVNKES